MSRLRAVVGVVCSLTLAGLAEADSHPPPVGDAPRPAEVIFAFSPVRSPVALGSDIRVSDAEWVRRSHAQPLMVAWRIVKRGTAIVVLQGTARVRGSRTPLRVRTRPGEAGEYELVFEGIPPVLGVRLRVVSTAQNRIAVITSAALPPRGPH